MRRRGQCNGRCTEWDDHKGGEWEMWVCCKDEDWHCKAFVRSQTGGCGGLGDFTDGCFQLRRTWECGLQQCARALRDRVQNGAKRAVRTHLRSVCVGTEVR